MTIDPFPSAAPPLVFHTNEEQLTGGMAELVDLPDFMIQCAGLVDLTGAPAMPPYAGFNDNEMIFPGSLQKIVAMYAAFELRSRVRQHVAEAIGGGLSTSTPGWEATVIADLEAAWKPILDSTFPQFPSQFPQLTRIFSFSPDGDVDFSAAPLSEATIDAIGEEGAPTGSYHDWMRLMMRWSNNAAASRCIRALGYSYINGVLLGAQFIDSELQNGLWMSGDYLGNDWLPNPPGQPQANAAGRALSPRWEIAQGRHLSNFTATAAQLATLLTLLATDGLVDAPASQEMRELMSAANGGIGSYVAEALSRDGRDFTSIISKIGFGDDTRSHDCAIVERTVGDTPIRYVVVGLGSRPFKPSRRRELDDLFIQLDQLIVARNT
jgi:Beta-lactamase enzyme family